MAQFEPPGSLEQVAYGKLTVYSDILGSDVYVDAKFVGQDRATITNIPTGKHYVRVTKGEEEIQSGIVSVKEGEETIVVAKKDNKKLEEKSQKLNHVLFYGSWNDLAYKETIASGTIDWDNKPQYGFGAEIQFNLPVLDIRLDLGFNQNYPSGLQISPSQEAQMAVSTPYMNISKNIFKTNAFKINGGVGVNYGIFSPGYQTLITIESRIGYQYFLEAVRAGGVNQTFTLRAGYANYNGRSAYPGDVAISGVYLLGGVGYQL